MEKRELELKGQLVKLQESLQKAADEDLHIADDKEAPDDEEVECETSHCPENCDTNLNHSKWMQILGTGLVVKQRHLCNAEKGAEFACVHNRDSTNFMNQDNCERYILRKTKTLEPYEWDLLDETGKIVVEHIVEDKDQGPSKEWGPYGWYCYPSLNEIV